MNNHPYYPIDNTQFTFDQIQKQHNLWSTRNFGEQPSFLMCLGVVEEFGELSEGLTEFAGVREALEGGKAFDFESFVDALGDMLVYLTAYATCRGWSMSKMWILRNKPKRDYAEMVINLGRLCHCELKRVQGIRGTSEELDKKAQTAFMAILAEVDGMAQVAEYEALDILGFVWAKVGKRDWKKDPLSGGEGN